MALCQGLIRRHASPPAEAEGGMVHCTRTARYYSIHKAAAADTREVRGWHDRMQCIEMGITAAF